MASFIGKLYFLLLLQKTSFLNNFSVWSPETMLFVVTWQIFPPEILFKLLWVLFSFLCIISTDNHIVCKHTISFTSLKTVTFNCWFYLLLLSMCLSILHIKTNICVLHCSFSQWEINYFLNKFIQFIHLLS